MSIRLGNSCQNCEKYSEGFCMHHKTNVGTAYTCDSFEMMAALKDDPNCATCSRYLNPDCANPQKAAPGMLCNHWAPRAQA
ncbi:hypothetical protein PP178_13235 [Zeaxanthinibacter sp. PT1]|uniref:hypothetical protein n=1 Tax=Zeaxanthinibacter TaxID=561554 RepID=UPI0017B265CA|nr:hypothetical protein [Zeaxanthinibacter sp. PT1]MDC6352518.1 hypothetical protein [Zeaxanthinibacter sp. PT1]NNF18553.1 hypothetical protein [Flavobacteriaceae bacterium]